LKKNCAITSRAVAQCQILRFGNRFFSIFPPHKQKP
jgi:hypothetical protein